MVDGRVGQHGADAAGHAVGEPNREPEHVTIHLLQAEVATVRAKQ